MAKPAQKAPSRDLGKKITAAGQRLNDAMAAMQDIHPTTGDFKLKRQIEDEYLDAVKYYVQYLVKPLLPNDRQLAAEYYQAAYLGAVEALRTWDRNRGAASSVVAFAVRKALHRQVRHSEFPMLSDHDFTMRGKIAREVRQAENADVTVSDEEMAKSLGLPKSSVERIRRYVAPSSIDRKLTEDDLTLGDLLVGDEDVPLFDFDADAERELIAEALRRVDSEFDDIHALYTVIRSLGLDDEEPDSFPKIKSHLGKTNTESLRLRQKKYVEAMKREARKLLADIFGDRLDLDGGASLPILGVLDTEESDEFDSFEERVRKALEAEARLVGGDDFDVTSQDGQILTEILEAAFRDELETLVAWHFDEIGDLEDRLICQHCLSPNSPKQYRTWGCHTCGKVETSSEEALFMVKMPYTLATIRASKAWERVARRSRGGALGRSKKPKASEEWVQPTLDGLF